MRRLALGLTAVVLLLTAGAAVAMQTTIYTGDIAPRKSLDVYITTNHVGDVSAEVTWVGKPSGHGIAYYLWVEHCTDESGTCDYAYDMACHTSSLMWDAARMTCAIPNGPAGVYLIEFAANTKATATMTVTAETD